MTQVTLYYKMGCPPCEATMPIWKELKAELPNIKFNEIESQNVTPDMGIRGFPTIKINKNNNTYIAVGYHNKTRLKNKIQHPTSQTGGLNQNRQSRFVGKTYRYKYIKYKTKLYNIMSM